MSPLAKLAQDIGAAVKASQDSLVRALSGRFDKLQEQYEAVLGWRDALAKDFEAYVQQVKQADERAQRVESLLGTAQSEQREALDVVVLDCTEAKSAAAAAQSAALVAQSSVESVQEDVTEATRTFLALREEIETLATTLATNFAHELRDAREAVALEIAAVKVLVTEAQNTADDVEQTVLENKIDLNKEVHEVRTELEALREDYARAIVESAENMRTVRERVAQLVMADGETRRIAEAAAQRTLLRGEPGRDGVFRAPVGWERGREFVQGTFARHRGGLWWSYRDTDSEPGSGANDTGWVIVADGVARIDVVAGDASTNFTLAVLQSSGALTTHEVDMPIVEFRGVWSADEEYAQNALVVRTGSLWIAKRASRAATPSTPEAADDWQLVAKRGKDGIDAAAERGWNFCNVYEFGRAYEHNDVVRAGATLWIARKRTSKAPKVGDDWAVMLSADAEVHA